MSPLELYAQAFRSVTGKDGIEFIRGAVRALVSPLGAELAIIAERMEGGRYRPLAAFVDGSFVEAELGAPEELGTLEARARAILSARAPASDASSWRCVATEAASAVCILMREPIAETLDTAIALIAARASAEIARMRSEREARRAIEQREAHQSALLRLARLPDDPWPVRLRTVLSTAAHALDVDRVGYFTLASDGDTLDCEELFVLTRDAYERGEKLSRRDVEGNEGDQREKGPRLSVPVWNDGRLAGVLLFSHESDARAWTAEEKSFAGSVAKTLSLALEADARLRAEERYRFVSNASGEVVWEWIVENEHIDWNENIQNVFGYASSGNTTLEQWLSRVHAADRARVDASLHAFLASSEATWEEEYRFTRADGTTAFVRDRGAVVRAPDGRALRMIGSMADITRTRLLEQRLNLAERMASMGTLAAGVAHEINNPLAYLKGNVEHVLDALRGRPGIDADLVAALEEAKEGAERVRRIVQDLRLFSQPQDGPPAPIDVDRVIESALAMARKQIRDRARLVTALGHPPAVEANEARFGQVMLNLIINALQSMPEGDAKNELRVASGVDDAGRVVVTIADTGAGIAPEHASRIFDPFFTTKPVGEGIGLGLSIAHSIITSFDGEITVDSAPGIGTTVRVILPASDREPSPPRPSSAPPSSRR